MATIKISELPAGLDNAFQNRIYTITKDPIDDDMNPRRELPEPLPMHKLKFRLKDDDGNIYFEGLILNVRSERLFNPLDGLGAGYGCTSIEIFEKGAWEYV